MAGPNQAVELRHPRECNADELDTFEALVLDGEVQARGLGERIRAAKLLAIVQADGITVSSGAIKGTTRTSRQSISRKSGYRLPGNAVELGYVVVREGYENRGIATRVTKSLMEAHGPPYFATTDSNNEKMHRVLQKCGFRRVGESWR